MKSQLKGILTAGIVLLFVLHFYSIADLNKDFRVDLEDIALFSENWMQGL